MNWFFSLFSTTTIILVILLSLYPIYRLIQHLRQTNARVVVWIGFILLLLGTCNRKTTTQYKGSNIRPVSQPIKQVKIAYSVWEGKLNGANFAINIIFDSVCVKQFSYYQILSKRDEVGPSLIISNEMEDEDKFTKEVEFRFIQKEKSKLSFIHSNLDDDLYFRGKCNYNSGKCEINIGNITYQVPSQKRETLNYLVLK